MFLKRSIVIALSVFTVMFIAACGSYTTTGGGPYGSGSTTPPATTTPTTGGNGSSAVVQTATVTVKGQSETVLTNAKGLTLYYFTPDSTTKTACTSGCPKVWPPLLFTGSGTPLGDSSLSGMLSVLTDANGNQVQYNGHLLYIYSGDTAAGQTTGAGLFGKWFVCTPGLTALAA